MKPAIKKLVSRRINKTRRATHRKGRTRSRTSITTFDDASDISFADFGLACCAVPRGCRRCRSPLVYPWALPSCLFSRSRRAKLSGHRSHLYGFSFVSMWPTTAPSVICLGDIALGRGHSGILTGSLVPGEMLCAGKLATAEGATVRRRRRGLCVGSKLSCHE